MKSLSVSKAVIAALCACTLFFLTDPAAALQPQDCASLMQFGIYDKYRSLDAASQYRQAKHLFSSYHFETRAQAEAKAGSLGLNIVDILELKLAGTSSSNNFEQWQHAFLEMSFDQAEAAGLKVQSLDKVSGAITELVKTCLTQKGLHAYIIPAADRRSFSFTVDYVPLSSTKPETKGIFQVTPSSVATSCAPSQYMNNEVSIGPQGVSVSCTRLPTETVTITVNTQDGSPVLHYDAVVTPKANVAFGINPTRVKRGQTATLTWSVQNASRIELEDVGDVGDSGTRTVTPTDSTEYRLWVTGLDGGKVAYLANLGVDPPPPTFSGASIFFRTTDNDKDDDTHVSVSIKCGGSIVASVSGTWGHWDDNSDHGWYGLNVTERPEKASMSGCTLVIVESPNGHDEWHFKWYLSMGFSDKTQKAYDGNGNLDYDRTTLTASLP